MAPEKALQEEVIARVAKALDGLAVADYRLRMLKMGNTINVLIHIKLGADFELNKIAELDAIRVPVRLEMDAMEGRVTADLVFIDDMQLAG